MNKAITESVVELAALDWLRGLGYEVLSGLAIAPGEPAAERADYKQVFLFDRLQTKLEDLNPQIPAEGIAEAIRKLRLVSHPTLIENNRAFHKLLVEGVDVEFRNAEGRIENAQVKLIDFENPVANEFLAVNQFTVEEGHFNRRADVVVFVNGIPLAVLELKNITDAQATIRKAFEQFQTYKAQIPSLFHSNALLVISDGHQAKLGTITSDWDRFMVWRTITGKELAPIGSLQLDTLLRGVFDKHRLLDLIRNFIVFEDDGEKVIKKLAGYHQFHAVNKAIETTLRAAGVAGNQLSGSSGRESAHSNSGAGNQSRLTSAATGDKGTGDRRAGVIWHTQGSGKSLSMVFYAGKIIQHPAMENPTIVMLTDRNDLDDQLFDTFSFCSELLRQKPIQAESREHLRDLLKVASGGVVFTTIQKFFPDEKGAKHEKLSDRRNIIVIADEAHRSQYDFVDGFAAHMREALPKASFIGFTGTPIEKGDKNTQAVFGDYIDVYDIQQAKDDHATVPIYYEARLAKIDLKPEERPKIDPNFEEVTEDAEAATKQSLKQKWAQLEAMVGTEKRIGLVAEDLVKHWEARYSAMLGKAMIVCMSRRICVELYEAIRKLRPDWHHDDDDKGTMKIVMSGSASDKLDWQKHIRSKGRREELAKAFKNPKKPFKIVIVRDMWLTGFDAPSLHTMYVDKPMKGHNLMQAIARVNRVFKDKPGGLVVDYLGLAEELKLALADYTNSKGKGEIKLDQEEAVAVMSEKYEQVCAILHGFDFQSAAELSPANRLPQIGLAANHVLEQADGKQRYLQSVTELSKAFALAVPHEKALEIRDEVGFFQEVRAVLAKSIDGGDGKKTVEELDLAVRQIVSRAISSDKVIDIFDAAGLKKPDISILSDEFLAEVQHLPQRNLAVELLQKLLNNEIKIRSKKFLIQSRSFAEMLEATIRKYQNRTIEAAQVIAELIELAKNMRAADKQGAQLGLTDDERAFYDALETNDSAVKVLGEPTLKDIAKELVTHVRKSVTIDWTLREAAQAQIRVIVRRILRKYGYPPDKQERATQTVLEQAKLLCADWAESS
ncbi:MAG TPA: type I restriction endonuclease subunit R [Verrucomicrobiae bacterium]|nr:type I restriction endonuclease subunit R [Verrucomicrobiae bacterium]